MKKKSFIFFALIALTTNALGSGQKGSDGQKEPTQSTHLANSSGIDGQTQSTIDRLDPVVHRLVDMLSQDTFPADF